MKTIPFSFDLTPGTFIPTAYDNYIRRQYSALKGQYLDKAAHEAIVAAGDPLSYEVYEIRRPELAGEVLHGISILHPGKVGDEYAMTKGHFHTVRDTGEVYMCMKGTGAMVMETEAGETAVEFLAPGRVLYVLPNWAHRSVNLSADEDFVIFFAYPGHSGHDYSTIEKYGFRKLLVERDGQPTIIDNPRWGG